MKSILQKIAITCLTVIPALMHSQADLTVGFNHSYNPPSNCNNQITAIDIDICNNTGSPASNFIVAIYLYKPSTQQYWVLDHTTINSLSGNACVNITNWNINMNNYCCLPSPGTDYRIGVWVDTAEVVSETNENNNASLLTGNIQVCANNVSVKENISPVSVLDLSPNPSTNETRIGLTMKREEKVKIVVYDITGKEILWPLNSKLPAGNHQTLINTENLKEGVYFVKVITPDGSLNKKLVVTKN